MASRQKIKTLPGKPYPMGVFIEPDGKVNFAVSLHSREECGVLLYLKGRRTPVRLPFGSDRSTGNVRCLQADGLQGADFKYNFYAGDEVITDPCAGIVYGNERWGKEISPDLKGGVVREPYDWEGDMPLMTPLADTVLYLLHPRGFTRHVSSGVKHRGTFVGIAEKIPHMKELGITAVELMPSYEFTELEKPPRPDVSMEAAKTRYMDLPEEEAAFRINYWGYKQGFYFAPKMSLSATGNPCREFKDMVKALHRAGIEVIMQFYFPAKVRQAYMLEVIRYWALVYHVDGFHLMGHHVPMAILATEPVLENVKLFYQDIPCQEIYDAAEVPVYRNLAVCNDGFLSDMRRFLKSDEDSLLPALDCLKRNPGQTGIINYITNYCGFTLADLVSYNEKHNEANGENGNDGENRNLSWNCGFEGKTKRKSILELRRKQMRNAMLLLLTAQGTPMIVAGDEFCFSHSGNNNPYCQDNPVNWLNWSLKEKNGEFYRFVQNAVRFRREHPVLHRETALTMLDYMACGYPDLSWHGEEAWKLQGDRLNRHAGVMYCGCYAKKDGEENDAFVYIAYNMHWRPHVFALPELPAGMQWREVCSTAEDGQEWQKPVSAARKGNDGAEEAGEQKADIHFRQYVKERSICILEGVETESRERFSRKDLSGKASSVKRPSGKEGRTRKTAAETEWRAE